MSRISVNQGRFAMQPQATIRRSVFDRSFVYKTTFDSGKLIPYFIDEVLPGDTFKLSVTEFCRMTTPIVPIMDNLYFETQFFYVPYRLVWDNWVRMCGEQDNPEDSTDFTVPYSYIPYDLNTVGTDTSLGDPYNYNYGIGTLYDYFGLGTASFGDGSTSLENSGPTYYDTSVVFSVLPFRAYWLIWNEWYRDENLQKSVKINKGDTSGPIGGSFISIDGSVCMAMGSGTSYENYGFPDGVVGSYQCAPRGKRYDYFTSCLPWPQKGEAVELPIGDTADVIAVNTGSSSSSGVPLGNLYAVVGDNTVAGNTYLMSDARLGIYGNDSMTSGLPSFTANGLSYDTIAGNLSVDLSTATAATINSLRQAFMLQRYYEIDARGGTRYTEKLQAHFGVTNPDSRLQRPEYLGGHSSLFNINPVVQTSSSDSTSPQGNLAAYGVHGSTYKAFNKSFTEFGIVIGLCSVRADLTYQQGIDRMWSRQDVYDFYWPSFAHLGEQAVLNKEIYAQGTSVDDEVFGYQERYAEYRYKPSKITGMFRSTFKESLDVWHLSQKFDSLPVLGDEFIQDHPPIERSLAITQTDDGLKYPEFMLDVKFHLKCVRPMPLYSVPGLMPHF